MKKKPPRKQKKPTRTRRVTRRRAPSSSVPRKRAARPDGTAPTRAPESIFTMKIQEIERRLAAGEIDAEMPTFVLKPRGG